jgi:hypothetical protein
MAQYVRLVSPPIERRHDQDKNDDVREDGRHGKPEENLA